MGKLSQTTKSVRKYVLYFLIFAFIVILLQNIYRYATREKDTTDPTIGNYALVDNAFGEITYPQIDGLSLTDGSNPVFSIKGQFESAPTSVNVYQIERPRETLGSVSRGQEIAKYLKLPEQYSTVENTLVWNSQNQSQRLEYNKITRDTHYLNTALSPKSFPDRKAEYMDLETINSIFSSVYNEASPLKKVGLVSETDFLTHTDSTYQETQVLEKAEFMRRDFFIEIEEVSIKSNSQTGSNAQAIKGRVHTSDPLVGTTNAIVLKRKIDSNFKAENILKEFNETGMLIVETPGVYRLKKIEQAWEDVNDGKASLVLLKKQGEDRFTPYTPLDVKRFIVDPALSRLGYYTTLDWSGYLYPIYIFEGNAEIAGGEIAQFIYYVPAIDSSSD